jgi:membrane-bound ClpP family serine protease
MRAKILFILLFLTGLSLPQTKVYVGNIDSEIDLGLTPYIKRVISEARKIKQMQLSSALTLSGEE